MFEKEWVEAILLKPIGTKVCHRWQASILFTDGTHWVDERQFLSPEAAGYSAKREIQKRFYADKLGIPSSWRTSGSAT